MFPLNQREHQSQAQAHYPHNSPMASNIPHCTASPAIRSIPQDAAGPCPLRPTYLEIRGRINRLIETWVTPAQLSDRLNDLPQQFQQPRPRPWERIHWAEIAPDQIRGVELELFLQVLASAAEIETPIRDYSQESWGYFHQIHSPMAEFIGGQRTNHGTLLSPGTWEKEERQHAPVFRKLYACLGDRPLTPKPNSVSGYTSSGDPSQDLYDHILSRIATEWAAASVYLWLMAHSTGELQHAIAQPFQDEINHLAKFWGFSRWALDTTYRDHLQGSTRSLLQLLLHHQQERTYGPSVLSKSLHLSDWRATTALAFSLTRMLVRLRRWNLELSPSYLRHLFGPRPSLWPALQASQTAC